MSLLKYTFLRIINYHSNFSLITLWLNRINHSVTRRALVDNTFLQTIWLDDNTAFESIPPNLFYGNPKVTQIRIRGNALRTIDATQLPLDQLHQLYLADNPFDCNCSLLWLWRLANGVPSAQSPSDATAHTNGPLLVGPPSRHVASHQLMVDKEKLACNVWTEQTSMHRVSLRDLTANEIECPASVSFVVLCLLAALCVVLGAVLLALYVRRRRRKWRHDRKNVLERLGPESVGKVEFEYRSQHQQWELPPRLKDELDELDHYEQFDDFRYDHRRHIKEPPLHPPNVVYV